MPPVCHRHLFEKSSDHVTLIPRLVREKSLIGRYHFRDPSAKKAGLGYALESRVRDEGMTNNTSRQCHSVRQAMAPILGLLIIIPQHTPNKKGPFARRRRPTDLPLPQTDPSTRSSMAKGPLHEGQRDGVSRAAPSNQQGKGRLVMVAAYHLFEFIQRSHRDVVHTKEHIPCLQTDASCLGP